MSAVMVITGFGFTNMLAVNVSAQPAPVATIKVTVCEPTLVNV